MGRYDNWVMMVVYLTPVCQALDVLTTRIGLSFPGTWEVNEAMVPFVSHIPLLILLKVGGGLLAALVLYLLHFRWTKEPSHLGDAVYAGLLGGVAVVSLFPISNNCMFIFYLLLRGG